MYTNMVLGTNACCAIDPAFDFDNAELRCPITNAKVGHHGKDVTKHPLDSSIPSGEAGNDATACPALQAIKSRDSVNEATCPVVGSVSAGYELE